MTSNNGRSTTLKWINSYFPGHKSDFTTSNDNHSLNSGCSYASTTLKSINALYSRYNNHSITCNATTNSSSGNSRPFISILIA